MQVDHALDDIKEDFDLLIASELLLLFVELVEEAAVLQVLSDEGVLVGSDAHPHVEHDVGML